MYEAPEYDHADTLKCAVYDDSFFNMCGGSNDALPSRKFVTVTDTYDLYSLPTKGHERAPESTVSFNV